MIDWEDAVEELRRAITFYDQVRDSPPDEQVAVGTDHHDWLERAARKVAGARFPFDEEPSW